MVVTIILWIVSWWNVENLLDNHHDSFSHFQSKVEHVAQVICNMGKWEQPVLVGLCEVENDYCLHALCRALVQYPYRPIHFDSPDERGIDVAVLYDSTRFLPIHTEPLHIDLGEDATRDILYVNGTIFSLLPDSPLLLGSKPRFTDSPTPRFTIHCFFCHLPSMRGGAAASEWKRNRAKAVIQQYIDTIFAHDSNATILVMGDMNSAPKNDLQGLTNLMLPFEQRGEGTHFYQNRWSCLDQCYLSPSLAARATVAIYRPSWMLIPDKTGLDSIPHRTSYGFRTDRSGYSDHLPLLLKW